MIAALNLNHLIRLSAESMLNCILEGVIIGFFAWILLRVIGRRNSGTRFAVWFSALLAIAALPVLGIATSDSAAGRAHSALTVPGSWALDFFIVWAVVAGVSLLRVGVGLLQLRTLRANCAAIDVASLDPRLRATLQEFQRVRPVTLCRSKRLQVPTAIGFVKPIIVIPSWALQELSTAELHSILIHELAHLRRWDDWTNLAQQVLKSLLFFHPAVWWIEDQLALEREMACDDAVLAETGNPRGYAQCLVSMAEKSFLRRGLALAQAAVNRMRQTSLRVSQILDTNRSTATRVWKPALFSVAGFFVVCLVSLSHAPELVAFQDRMPDATTASMPSPHRTLTATTTPNFQAVARPVSFLANSAGPTTRPTSKDRVQPGRMRSLWEGSSSEAAKKIDDATSSPRARKREHIVNALVARLKSGPSQTWVNYSFSAALPQSADYRTRQRMSSPPLQIAEYRIWEGTSSLVPQSAANYSGLRPLRQQVSEEADSTIGQPILTQAIFVVTETQYDESQASLTVTVWHLTVLDTTQTQARIPAKQI
jgi:beta-lactamase regulating signal transducer with metallopeptidase domain